MPTVRLRRLAAEMRRLREQANLTREQVSARTGINEVTLYRLEAARVQRPQRRTLISLLDLYHVDEEHRNYVLMLAREGIKPGWLLTHEIWLSDGYKTYINFEVEARRLSSFELSLVPGLLQTADYTRAVVRDIGVSLTQEQVDQQVDLRMHRQQLLSKPDPLQLWAIVDEAVLHRVVGGVAVMRSQLSKLATISREPNIVLQVIPFSAGAHAGMPGAFLVMDFSDPADPPVVYIDSFAGQLFQEGEAQVGWYRTQFEHLQAVALSPQRSRSLIETLADSSDRS